MADNRGLLGDSRAFTEALGDGVWDAGTGMVKGLGDLAKGGYEIATDANARESAWETTKQLADAAADYSKSVIENPGEAYRYAREIGDRPRLFLVFRYNPKLNVACPLFRYFPSISPPISPYFP